MLGMLLTLASEADYPAIIKLVNLAYRGTSGKAPSWNVENGVLEGQRIDDSLLREELAEKPEGHLLTWREEAGGELLGTVWVEPCGGGVWYLGMLAVRPDLQMRRLGSGLLAAAESFARARGARRMRIAVLHLRDGLIGWYERRGYVLNGETEPFPYGDERYGTPMRDDLYFLLLEKDMEKAEFLD
jgi:ribosomal protein S18 acetylase RimI-like enzyme